MRRSAGLLVVVAFVLAACAGGVGEADRTRDWTEHKLYLEAKAALDDGDYETAIDYYGKLGARFPFGGYAAQGQLELIYAYYKSDEPDSAVEEADRFIRFHPTHPEVAYAYYLKALTNQERLESWWDRFTGDDRSLRDMTFAEHAFRDFRNLVERYPDTKYASDARRRMHRLRDGLARHELAVAEFYLDRKAWVAAVGRASYLVENFPSSPSATRALAIMARAYRALGMEDLAADALRVLRLNDPAQAASMAGG